MFMPGVDRCDEEPLVLDIVAPEHKKKYTIAKALAEEVREEGNIQWVCQGQFTARYNDVIVFKMTGKESIIDLL